MQVFWDERRWGWDVHFCVHTWINITWTQKLCSWTRSELNWTGWHGALTLAGLRTTWWAVSNRNLQYTLKMPHCSAECIANESRSLSFFVNKEGCGLFAVCVCACAHMRALLTIFDKYCDTFISTCIWALFFSVCGRRSTSSHGQMHVLMKIRTVRSRRLWTSASCFECGKHNGWVCRDTLGTTSCNTWKMMTQLCKMLQ
jgi:hypothetical protein